MKIVDRKTFLDLPPGTVYAKYEPYFFGELHVKEHSLIFDGGYAGDFVCQGLGVEIECTGSYDFNVKCQEAETGKEVSLNYDCAGRDAYFEPDQLFAVLSKEDVQSLIKRLSETLSP